MERSHRYECGKYPNFKTKTISLQRSPDRCISYIDNPIPALLPSLQRFSIAASSLSLQRFPDRCIMTIATARTRSLHHRLSLQRFPIAACNTHMHTLRSPDRSMSLSFAVHHQHRYHLNTPPHPRLHPYSEAEDSRQSRSSSPL